SDPQGTKQNSAASHPPSTAVRSVELRVNDHAVINDRPCQINDISFTLEGLHLRGRKVSLVGVDVHTGQSHRCMVPDYSFVSIPTVVRSEFTLLDVTADGFMSLLTDDGQTKDDVKVPGGGLGRRMRAAFGRGVDLMVTVVTAMDEETCIGFRENKGD
ncbi:eukaryotic elongation factor 5A hypusine, DNA-binding OB fold-domain-containing protein, partial [Zopfochytrium polystomum]